MTMHVNVPVTGSMTAPVTVSVTERERAELGWMFVQAQPLQHYRPTLALPLMRVNLLVPEHQMGSQM